MIRNLHLYSLLILAISLSNCTPDNPTTPTNLESPSPIPVSPTFTATPTETVTPTLPATFTPLEVNERIRAYLQNTVEYCLAPCFWGITPEQTTLDEATNIFVSLGLQPEHTLTQNNQEFYDTDYHIEKGFEISIILTVQDGIIKSLDAGINVPAEVSIPRKWAAYSPETLITQYGVPSKVDFFLGRVTPTPTHSMVLYFENSELIVAYIGSDLLNNSNPQLEICPTTNQVGHIQIWLGKNPRHPPKQGVPLEEASNLTVEEFSKLMLGDPSKACFNLKEEAFP
ncbi:MAG: hypothetical protein HND47_20020 [Chloroflexi bacterium]|nr:hypothetical protein [Chloroflexota bacterium]